MFRNLKQAVVAAMGLAAAVAFTERSTQAGVIVVGHDVNTLSTSLAGTNEEQFAVNVASFLTSGHATKNLLLFEANSSDPLRDYAPAVSSALTAAGFNVTVTTNYATSFTGFDAVFAAQQFPSTTFLNNNALINYVNNGGGVYLAGGVGNSAPAEAAGWNTFMHHFGLAFDGRSYDGVLSPIPITSAHPIFNGVSTLGAGNGSAIIDLGTNPNAQIVQTFGGQGMYAVVQPAFVPTPEPSSIALACLGIVGLIGLRRRS